LLSPMPAEVVTSATAIRKENARAFAFVEELAQGLSRREIELPSFPEVAIRVRRVLSDDNVSSKDVVRVVGTEPTLAARIMQMANSAALGHIGRPISDLRTAITRIGFNLVRSAAISFAMSQLRKTEKFKPLGPELQAHWERSSLVASCCHQVARRITRVNSDMALLAGLLHGVGRLYILTRALRHRELFADQAAYQEIEANWHLSITRALLESWAIPEEIIQAIEQHEDLAREHEGMPDLTDVLAVGARLASHHKDPAAFEASIVGLAAAERMGLDSNTVQMLCTECSEEALAMRETLGL
jgi:HD-like signal output (HDOD) protein